MLRSTYFAQNYASIICQGLQLIPIIQTSFSPNRPRMFAHAHNQCIILCDTLPLAARSLFFATFFGVHKFALLKIFVSFQVSAHVKRTERAERAQDDNGTDTCLFDIAVSRMFS